MDSGNSGSMQSSSGGDDQEYDSRADSSISPLFNPSISFAASISNNPQPPQPPSQLSHRHSHQPPTTLLDPHQPHNLQPFSHSPPDLDLVWSGSGLGSEPNYSNLGNFTALSSFPSSTQSLLGLNQGPGPGLGPLQSLDGNSGRATPTINSVSEQNQNQTNVGLGKNSRKRTRASRRAPTTVLTTDPSNFRQMVQEFTGIPAPPFSASPYSRRLDLFGGGGSALGQFYPFRPSAQKVQIQPSPFVSSSSSSPPSMLLNTMASTSNNNESNTFSNNNYHMNMQNPVLTFQSLLQSNGPLFGTKSQGNSGIPSIDELGMAQQHVNANLREFSDNNLSRWRGEEAANDQDQHLGASFDGNNGDPQNGTGRYKMNGSGSTSDFRSHEKGMESVSGRNEGTVDSWICPSD